MLTIALLLLCCSICPHSGYPSGDEDDGPTGATDNLENEEDHEQEFDQDVDVEALDEEDTFLKERADVEYGPSLEDLCQVLHGKCGIRKCCRKKGEELKCGPNYVCVKLR